MSVQHNAAIARTSWPSIDAAQLLAAQTYFTGVKCSVLLPALEVFLDSCLGPDSIHSRQSVLLQ